MRVSRIHHRQYLARSCACCKSDPFQQVTFSGKPIDPLSQNNGFGFVPQDDTLIGKVDKQMDMQQVGQSTRHRECMY